MALRRKETKENVEQASQASDPAQSLLEDEIQMDEDDTLDQQENAATEATPSGGLSRLLKKLEEEEEGMEITGKLLALDEAVIKSIENCGEYQRCRLRDTAKYVLRYHC